jgi:hypothetical protein
MPVEGVYDFVRAWSFKDRPKPYLTLKGTEYIYLWKEEIDFNCATGIDVIIK